MTVHKSIELATEAAEKLVDGGVKGGRVRLYRASVDFSKTTVASGDSVIMLVLPDRGHIVAARFGATVTLGTSTVKIGTTDDDDAFRAAATKTDCKPEEMMLPFLVCAGQTVVMAVATANAPGSGIAYVDYLIADV